MIRLVDVYRQWPDHKACVDHLEAIRWRGKPACPYCHSEKVSRHNDASRALSARRWQCQDCARSFSVTVGTIFHNSHVDLQRWFLLISLMLDTQKRLSAAQAARELAMRRPTVSSMMQRVRQAMDDDDALLAGIVEAAVAARPNPAG